MSLPSGLISRIRGRAQFQCRHILEKLRLSGIAKLKVMMELIDKNQIVQEVVSYPFNENDSWFTSSDTVLNKVWDLCKYSMKATSFTGIYIDGDRERIPYEADAYINQLGHYCVAHEYSMARYTHEYLIHHPTWPTEWILQSVLMAWNDYMYTGNKESLMHFYNDLKAKTLIALEDESGFISTTTGRVTPEVLQSIHFDGKLRDIVDWPQPGAVGVDKNAVGEIDGFVLKDVNTAVNAFHYRALILAGEIAGLLGEQTDRKMFLEKAQKLKTSFNNKLLDKKTGIYTDGIGTDHKSLHASMFPLALGLVPDKNTRQKFLNLSVRVEWHAEFMVPNSLWMEFMTATMQIRGLNFLH